MKRSRIEEIIKEEVTEFGKNPKKQAFNEEQARGDVLLSQAIKAYGAQMGGVKNLDDLKELRDIVLTKVSRHIKTVARGQIGEKREV